MERFLKSLPSRERGLKLKWKTVFAKESRSLPSRERGLKHIAYANSADGHTVAPFAGAWIETQGAVAIAELGAGRSLRGSVD